jgi:membrane protein YdbS with pleckstrin-like domain
VAQRPARVDPHPSTGPIPVVRADDLDPQLDDDLDATPQESALAWLRFAGELVIALAAGVGVYFAATVLWEMVPHVAVLLAPLAVTGLVAGVGMWRQRQGREQMGARLLAILVFAGTLLTIAPAAGLLAGS